MEVGGWARWAAGQSFLVVASADVKSGSWNIQINGGAVRQLAMAPDEPPFRFQEGTQSSRLQRLSLRTGSWRGIATCSGADSESDYPLAGCSVFHIRRVAIKHW